MTPDKMKVSSRGVYYDLSISPYEFITPYGDIFKFSSKKKMEIYTRDVKKEIDRVDKALGRYGVIEHIPAEIVALIKRQMYEGFYRYVER